MSNQSFPLQKSFKFYKSSTSIKSLNFSILINFNLFQMLRRLETKGKKNWRQAVLN